MANRTDKSRFNVGAFLLFLLSFLSLLACYLVYSLLPVSDSFTNSPDYSGAQTVSAFMAAPIAGVLATVFFLVFVFLYRKYFKELALSDNTFGDKTINGSVIEWTSLISTVVLTVMIIISTVFAFYLWSEFRNLGFVAPITDTSFENHERFILADCIIHFIFLLMTTVKMAGVSVPDLIAGLFNRKKETADSKEEKA